MTKINNRNNKKRDRNTLYESAENAKPLLNGLKVPGKTNSASPDPDMPEVKTLSRSKQTSPEPEKVDLRKQLEAMKARAEESSAPETEAAATPVPNTAAPPVKKRTSAASRIKKMDLSDTVVPEEEDVVSAPADPVRKTKSGSQKKHAVSSKISAITPEKFREIDLGSTTEIKLAAIQTRLKESGKYRIINHSDGTVTEPEPQPRVIDKIKPAADKLKPAADRIIKKVSDIREKPEEAVPEEAPVSEAGQPAAEKAEKPEPVFEKPAKPEPAYRIRRKTNKGLIAAVIIVLALAAIYFGGYYLWQGRFLPNTYINAQNVGNMTPEKAEVNLLPQNTVYTLTELDRQESIPLSAVDFDMTFTDSIAELSEAQNRFLWPFALFSKKEITNAVNISFDEDKLKSEVQALDAFNEDLITDPEDAHLGKGTSGHYEVIPEVMGNRLDFDRTFGLIRNSLADGCFSLDITDKGCYLTPSVYSDDKSFDEMLRLVKLINEEVITIDLTGATEVLEPMDIVNFLIFDSHNDFTINEDYLSDYIDQLAETYNTYLTERDFKTHTGKVIKVGGNHTETSGLDTYGFLMNRDETKNILRECILSMQDQTFEPVWDVPALTRNDVNGDIGDTYIEISLTEQHLWMYKKGTLVYDTDVVTGLDVVEARRTPWGVFRAYDKAQNVTLKGEMGGERWNTPVAYWISVTWTAVGIHDAVWQPGFGGELYKVIGSHGCINVSLESAASIYELVDIGTPIVIYY